MRTDADRKAQNKYNKEKCKNLNMRFYPKDMKLYEDFRKKCEEQGVYPTTQLKSLMDQWTYLDIGF